MRLTEWTDTCPPCLTLPGFARDAEDEHAWERAGITRWRCLNCGMQRRAPRKGEIGDRYRPARADWRRIGIVQAAQIVVDDHALEITPGLVLWRQGDEWRMTAPRNRPRSRK